MRILFVLAATLTFVAVARSMAWSQSNKQVRPSIHDSLDHKLDMSDLLIEANGFIPVPILVTEPALGGFGLGVAPVFIKRRAPAVDRKGKSLRIPPDVTGGAALYTINNSWTGLIFRQGTWLKARSKYRVGGGYANINMKFYRTASTGAETSTEFNLRTTPVTGSLLKRFGSSPWSAGLEYTFLNTRVSAEGTGLPDFVRDREINSKVSMPGLILEFDSRDNIFTPNSGIRTQVNVSFSDDGFGSDYNYENLTAFFYGYIQMADNVVTGLRYELQQVFGDVPFYLKPYIELRGLPIARYQGTISSVGEVEVRWDVVPRWSAVAFAGTGKAYDSWNDFDDANWAVSGGAGVRYLIARKFKVRMGLDLARGPEQWAYYIVFGSSWLR